MCAAKMSLHDLSVPCTTRHPDCHIDGRDADIDLLNMFIITVSCNKI